MATEEKPKPQAKKYFDVSKPGKAMASPSARPTIVGHRTILKDPMVTTQTVTPDMAPASEHPKDNIPVRTVGTTIKPLTEPEKPAAKLAEAEATAEAATEPVAAESAAAEAPAEAEPKAAESETEPEAEAPKKPTPAADKPQSDDDTTDKPNPTNAAEKAEKEAAEKLEALEKTIADKTYFVPIGEHSTKHGKAKSSDHKSSAVPIFILLLLVVAIGADLAIDAGLVKTSFKAPLQIFHNQE